MDAAYRALVNEDPDRPLLPNIIHAFIGVKATVEGLYSSNFAKSALSGDLDVVVREMTDQDTISVGKRKHRELKEMVESEASEAELLNKKLVAQHYCPSSDSSCSSSPVPPLDESLTDDSEEDEEVSPPILAGRKRRLSSCSEPAHPTIPTFSTKRRKHMWYA